MRDELRAYLAWCWWLFKTCSIVVSITLNVYFFWLLSQIAAR